MLGRTDPRWASGSTAIDIRLTRLLRSFERSDSPPTQVKPLPLSLLHLASAIALQAGDPQSLAASDLMWLAFFFLLRPGEYSNVGTTSHPFRVEDVQLWHGPTRLQPLLSDPALLHQATFVTLTFSTQKMVHATNALVTAEPLTPHTSRLNRMEKLHSRMQSVVAVVD